MPVQPLRIPRPKKRIAVLIETSNRHGRSLIEGVAKYNRERRLWNLELFELARGASAPKWLNSWDGDGAIARVESHETARVLGSTGLPIVNLSAARLIPGAPLVETDDDAIANLAYRHLAERGLRNFAFCGEKRFAWSRSRARFLSQAVAQDGHGFWQFSPRQEDAPGEQRKQIASWLRGLPMPIGIVACYDVRARDLIEVCQDEGLLVPDEVAIVGIDDEPLQCQLSKPSLTSIALNSERMGYVAADLLARMMEGEELSGSAIYMEPLALIPRESTDILMTSDPLVAKALHFIQANSCCGIGVQHVVNHVGTSRRVLETRFQKCVGRTPHSEIMNVRVRRVQELLKGSELPLHRIAEETGFKHTEYLSVMFRRQTGEWPSSYRKRHRMSDIDRHSELKGKAV